MVRKSTRGAKCKGPCGACGFQCNDDAILWEDCGLWYHGKCENLPANDFKVLRRLTEDYLCSSCTHTRGRFDYNKALLRLCNSERNELLESGVKLETVLLRNTRAVQARTDELPFGHNIEDTVANDILEKAGESF